MSYSARVLRSFAVTTAYLATAVVTACSPGGSDGSDGAGAERSAGGRAGASTRIPAGGSGAGGANASVTGGGGGLGTGGSGEAGSPFDGQAGKGGGLEIAGGGSGSGGGGRSGAGGSGGRSGAGGTGGSGSGGKAGSGAGGKAGSGGAGAPGDACAVTTAPTGGTEHKTSNATGKAAGMDWALWSNGSGGSITTYDVPAFSAAWNNSGDFLARLGLQWNASKTYDQYGTITAQFAYKKTGTGGGYSYIGMYGWSVSPCVEWYIVDDSYNKMPVNPGSTTNKGTADIDGGKYTLYTRSTTGTGGSKCSGTTNWLQFYSIRQTARQCGQISVTAHFAAWAAAGMTLGKMDQAQILVEVGGGTGTVDFTVASVVAQ